MIATGIIRRIDDLGRVPIPKEIRRELRICENEPLEISFNRDTNEITIRKYETEWDEAQRIANEHGKPCYEFFGCNILFERERAIRCCGNCEAAINAYKARNDNTP